MVAEAGAELDAIPESEQQSPAVMSMRAQLYLQTREWERMEAAAKHVARMEPDTPSGWIHWAYALRELEKLEEAQTVARRGLERHPEEATLWFNLACYSSLLGEVKQAAIELAKATRLDKTFLKEAETDPDLANLRRARN